MTRPFLKWAGNKYPLVERIRSLLPPGQRCIEPFVGSAALFLNTTYASYIIGDANPDLINLYQLLHTQSDAIIAASHALFIPSNNDEEQFYKLRDSFNQTHDPLARAALFLYLNRHAYNGLCRYNAKGGFNTPFGRYKRPYFPERELLAFVQKLQSTAVEICCGSFEATMDRARPGDVVYCDPPYVPLSATAHFTAYSTAGFNLAAQQRLAAKAAELAARGIPVIISNHDTAFTRDLYHQASVSAFAVQRFISANGQKRAKAPELLAVFGDITQRV